MSEERLQRYLDGRMDDFERRAFEGELLESKEELREAYDELTVRHALARQAVSRRRAPSAHRATRPWWFWPTAGAAAVALVALLMLWPAPPETTTYRGDGGAELELLAPRGPVSGTPTLFRWSAYPGARSYRVEIFDRSGTRVLQSTTLDTVLRTEALIAGSWRVSALDSLGMMTQRSERVEFRPE